ncbi:hypothetical protein PS624_04962 [Pseudomonas fluorescens]|uniref:Uncharacterized protein n=1 Tax=Pseudomonas fluorescens TaxID=294 RepID=A0A5E6WW00_PSEFL|nr:hypothetical protein PS624_04962 [Pseudomonas fluorescens]
MFLRHVEPHTWTLDRRAAGNHDFDQSIASDLVDVARPTLGTFVNIRDLIRGEKIDTPAWSYGLLVVGVAVLCFLGRVQFVDGEQCSLEVRTLELYDQRRLNEQEHVRATFRCAGTQRHQRFEGGFIELLGVVHQQIDFLTGQCELHHLIQNRANFGLSDVQCLRHLAQHASSIAGATGGNHHALYRLLVGAGDQRLTQQRLAAALRASDHQQQLAITRQMMQLTQHRFALGREELEARYAWRERVVT